MFDAIARRYDALNHLLSVGLDRRWRRRGVAALALSGRERVLDVCCGTGDLSIEAATSTHGRARDVVALDFAGEMLRCARLKLQRLALSDRVRLVRGDATQLPLPAGSVDAAMIAFGIRNVVDPLAACREIHRVLRAGGRLMILEFGMPRLKEFLGAQVKRTPAQIEAELAKVLEAHAQGEPFADDRTLVMVRRLPA